MSNETTDTQNPVLSFIGTAFILAVPASLIVMLGVVGVAFMGGYGLEKKVEIAESAAAPAAPPAPADPAPSGGPPADPSSGAAAVTLPADDSVEVEVAGDGPSLELMEVGKSAYATCAACHGPDGKGLKAGPMLMAPSLVGSELLLGDPDAALLLTLKGIAKENMDYMGMMASLAAGLNDEKLAGVLTYTRNSWGNSAPEITVEQAAEARSKFADVDAPAGIKRADIQAIVDAHK
ncbi:MAG: cytochrome c [Verrucomicrobiota bacterium]